MTHGRSRKSRRCLGLTSLVMALAIASTISATTVSSAVGSSRKEVRSHRIAKIALRGAVVFRIGPYELTRQETTLRNPHLSLAAVEAALGPPSECQNSDPGTANFFWHGIGSGLFVNEKGLTGPPGCTIANRKLWLGVFDITGKGWHTPRGLYIRDPLRKLHRLYPRARVSRCTGAHDSPGFATATEWDSGTRDKTGGRDVFDFATAHRRIYMFEMWVSPLRC